MKSYTPHKYQERAFKHIMNNPFCGLFLDMGLGKTVITLTAVADLILIGKIKKVLIIAPLRVANTVWKQEVEKWMHTHWLRVSVCTGSAQSRKKALDKDAEIYVINRENTKWLCDYYSLNLPFDMLVIDELSSFKNHDSQRFRSLKKSRHVFKRIIGLTGTPVSNGYMDLWGEVFMLDGGERLKPFISQYREIYFTADRVGASEFAKRYTLRPGMDTVINNKIADICLSMKSKDYLSLPEFIVRDEYVSLPEHIFKNYKTFERDRIIELDETKLTSESAVSLTGKLLQWANGACYYEDENIERKHTEIHGSKVEKLLSLIEKANGVPVLVGYQFKHDLERIKNAISSAFPDMDIRALKTEKDIMDWNSGKIDVLLAHPFSAGLGLNLQFGGNILIWFGLTWSLEMYLQFNKRIHRQGIEKPVICYRILAKDTYDEIVASALNEKHSLQEALFEYIKKYQHFKN